MIGTDAGIHEQVGSMHQKAPPIETASVRGGHYQGAEPRHAQLASMGVTGENCGDPKFGQRVDVHPET